MTFSATYSPEDNKLRLSAATRLPEELYERVKAAGFKWAPRQEIFVAPMWTPGREDLCLELAGEIDDEDTSLVDRAEARADRFEGYRENRIKDAESAHRAVSAIADGIPMGQPILVGHHSERHARRDAEKIENGMRRAVRMWDTAQYWEHRAAGALRAAKYKELPSVRARRIKGLESDLRKEEKFIAGSKDALALWEKVAALPIEEQEAFAIRVAGSMGGNVSLPRKEGDREDWDQRCDAHAGLTNYYPNLYAPRTVAECVEAARVAYPNSIARHERWANHYRNRLVYERAMLAEAGGTVADRTKPEVGGGCKCWASPRGGWSYIVKVNRVSLTVRDTWNDGGPSFTRTIELDKIAGVMTKAEVETAREDGRLIESADKTGFFLKAEAADVIERRPAAEPNKFEAMREQVREGVKVVTAPQLFPTPRALAERMVNLARIEPSDQILEPSAGTGAIVDAILAEQPKANVYMVEMNHGLCEMLSQRFNPAGDAANGICRNVLQGDFLECSTAVGQFDVILMNPPFAFADDIDHIEHAIRCLKPGGRLVAICANGPRQNTQLKPQAEEHGFWEQLPAGTFSDAGTNVNTALLYFEAPK